MKVQITLDIPGLEVILREARGDKSLYEVARLSGLSHESIKRIEGTDKSRPDSKIPIETLLRVGAALGVDVWARIKIAIFQWIKSKEEIL
jgi:transcriptional regulator with XRE-family HTH domain